MSHNGAPTGKEPTVARSFSRLAHDAIELGELQAQLLTLDVRTLTSRMKTALMFGVASLVVLLGAVPIALLALAELLVAAGDWSRPTAVAAAAGVGVLAAVLLMAIGWRGLERGAGSLDRSREELKRNLDWIKSSLRQSTSPAHRKRS